jgi:hypothetical protein
LTAGGLPNAVITQATMATAVLPLGVGQSWQDLTASRAVGPIYTNSTGRTITVKLNATISLAGNAATMTITEAGGSPVVLWGLLVPANGTFSYLDVTVSPGATYSLSTTGGSISLNRWQEQR